MRDALQRVAGWAATHAPDIELNPPAKKKDIAAAEKRLGVRFPTELGEYFSIHNGQNDMSPPGLIGNWYLMELRSVVKAAELMNGLREDGAFGDAAGKPHPAIKSDWWNPGWVPVVDSGSGHHVCVDTDPNTAGRVGQVFLFLHDDARRYLIAHSLTEWFTRLADDLERGLYQLEDESFDGEALMWSSLEGRDIYAPRAAKKPRRKGRGK